MVPDNDDKTSETLESRPPTLEDLLALCRHLNDAGAKYIVIGGVAMIQHGFVRATEDIDLLVDAAIDNQEKVRLAMDYLPDHAIREMGQDDLNNYTVVRIADEIVVDLMKIACNVDYEKAASQVVKMQLMDVTIPFATPELLLTLKQGVREKDTLDRAFLQSLIAQRKNI